MTTMKGDVLNRVRRLPKPTKSSEALQPLFESVSNAVHAVEDKFQSQAERLGEITITISHLRQPDNFRAIISDNGVGLDTNRFNAFCTTDTDFKYVRGGKGVGRLLWLDAFEKIEVQSVFERGGDLYRRKFNFMLDPIDQITDEVEEPLSVQAPTGTIVTFMGIRPSYRDKFPSQAAKLIRYFGSHFLADFILEKSPKITLFVDEISAEFPGDVRQLLVEDRGEAEIATEDFGSLTLHSFVCKKEASADFDGSHQLHYVANGRTVVTRKIDGLLGIGRFGPNGDHVYHGCVTGTFLDERVNQERTNFNFDEKVSEEIAKYCANSARENALVQEVVKFDAERLTTLNLFLREYPSFQFEEPGQLLGRTPKNAVKAEQFAQALIPTRIRRDEDRRERVQSILSTLSGTTGIPEDFGEAVRQAAEDVRAEEQRQLTEYVLRRKMVLDVLDVLIRRVRERDAQEQDYHLESTLHQFICPMRIRGDDPGSVESSDHDLWVVDERLAFARYFASDLPFSQLLEQSSSGERPDVLLFDRLHGLGIEGDEPLRRVMLVEFKKPGRRDYDERYSPLNQVSRYLNELIGGRVESFTHDRIRIADDCVFYCYVIADIVGNLDVHTSTWRTTSNGRGRWTELSGKFRGSIEIIEWKDLISDARARNAGYIQHVQT